MPGSPLNFTIEGRMQTMPDVQRNWMWNLIIPKIRFLAPTTATLGVEDLIVRARTVSIPQRDNTGTESSFMGMKQWFPGKPTVDGTLAVQFEETEDQKIAEIFYEWQQNIFNIDPLIDPIAGKSNPAIGAIPGSTKRALSSDIVLVMYSYSGTPLGKMIMFKNAWVKTVSDVALDYGAGDSVKYTVTFQYDYWKLIGNPF